MPLPEIITPLFTQADTQIAGFMLSGASRVAAAAINPFRILVTVYIFFWGLAMWRGLIEEPLGDALGRLFRIVLIATIALGAGVYAPVIANFLFNTPGQLASVLLGAATTPESVMDVALNKGNDIAFVFFDRDSDGISGALFDTAAALIVWLFTAVVVLVGAALVLLSKIALGILIAFGPLFIALMLFDSTKNFFQSWLGQALNYLFIYSLVAAVVMVMFALWTPSLDYAKNNLSVGFSELLPMVIYGGAAIVVLLQVPGIASGLAGGVQIGTLGAIGWASNKLGAARRSTLRRETFRRADGSRGADYRGAVPSLARGAVGAARAIQARVRRPNALAQK